MSKLCDIHTQTDKQHTSYIHRFAFTTSIDVLFINSPTFSLSTSQSHRICRIKCRASRMPVAKIMRMKLFLYMAFFCRSLLFLSPFPFFDICWCYESEWKWSQECFCGVRVCELCLHRFRIPFHANGPGAYKVINNINMKYTHCFKSFETILMNTHIHLAHRNLRVPFENDACFPRGWPNSDHFLLWCA